MCMQRQDYLFRLGLFLVELGAKQEYLNCDYISYFGMQ